MLSGSRNLDYNNSDHLVISQSMETKPESAQVRRSIYPDIEPYDTGSLKVSDIHTLYYEQSGNPDGHVSSCYLHMLCTTSFILHHNYYCTRFVFFMEGLYVCVCVCKMFLTQVMAT